MEKIAIHRMLKHLVTCTVFHGSISLAFAAGPTTCPDFTEQNIVQGGASYLLSIHAGVISGGSLVQLKKGVSAECVASGTCIVQHAELLRQEVTGIEISRSNNLVCVAVPGKRPLDVEIGWIPASRWRRTSERLPSKRWSGVWQNYDEKIRIQSIVVGELTVTGDAIWPGNLGSPRFGNFKFMNSPQNGMLTSVGAENSAMQAQCQVWLRIVANMLIAFDNGKCGATNVTFNGIYRFRPNLQ